MEVALYKNGFQPTYLMLSISRYYSLVCLIFDVAFNLANGVTLEFCQNIHWVLPLLSTTIQFASTPLLLLRTYAIWDRNRTIAFILVTFWIGPLIIGIYVSTTYIGVPYSVILGLNVLGGCGNDPTNNWGTAPFIVNMIVDSCIFLLTLGRLLSLRNASAFARGTISRVLIRDGVIYYVVVVIINIINIVFFLAPGFPALARPLIATPATLAPAIIVGRLFFNLQNSFLSSSSPSSNSDTYPRTLETFDALSSTGDTIGEVYSMRPIISYTTGASTADGSDRSYLKTKGGRVKDGPIV
jgi:hypothetical protein